MVVDTKWLSLDDQHLLGRAAVVRDGYLQAWHVTDNPSRIQSLIRNRVDFKAAYGEKGRTAELGPGLYLSGAPELWTNRAATKWDFLSRPMTAAQIDRLVALLTTLVAHRTGLSAGESRYAERTLQQVVDGDLPADILIFLAGQPYNIPFWRASFLVPLGITPAPEPYELEVHLRGRFGEVAGGRAEKNELRLMRRARLDGAFIRGGFSGYPQIVVWNPKALQLPH